MGWYARLRNLARDNGLSRDLDREMAFHIAERTDDLVARGMSLHAAEREARRRFGNYGMQKERARDANLISWLDTLAKDVRYAARTLRASPAYTGVAILSLALGIGANTAIFSLMDAVVLRSLPVRHPEELVRVKEGRSDGSDYFTNPIWEQLRDHQDVFSGAFAVGSTSFNLADAGEERRAEGLWVSGDFFSTLGVRAVAGRTLARSDDFRGCPGVAAVSHSFWLNVLRGDPAAIGKRIALDGHAIEVVGVIDPGFFGVDVGRRIQVYAPLCSQALITGTNSLDHRSTWYLRIVGRPKPALGLAQVRARLGSLSPAIFERTLPSGWSAEQRRDYLARRLDVSPSLAALSGLRRTYARALAVLMAMVAVVLLIACANVANLMLARATARQREMAVRVALGAARGRLVRQLFTESLLLSLCGATLGLLFARWGSHLLVTMLSTSERTVDLDLALDLRVLAFTTAAAIATGILFGLAPAWRATRVDPQTAMKAQGRGVAEGHSRLSVGKMLVVAQVALSLVLVAGAGLLLGSFRTLATLDPGFRTTNVLVIYANLRAGGRDKGDHHAMQRHILDRLRALPGVRSASVSTLTPISGSMWNDAIVVPGFTPTKHEDEMVYMNAVSDGYFVTMGSELLAGRDVDSRDTPAAPKVAVVNETLAKRFFAGRSPLGQSFRLRHGDSLGDPIEIVGVVGDAKYQSLRHTVPATAFVAVSQDTAFGAYPAYELRSDGDPIALAQAAKAAIAEVAPRASLQLTTLDRQVAESLTRERLLATLSGFFGVLALVLATIGLYGIMSYTVARRRNEIGIRIALGAAQTRVMRLVLGEVGRMVTLGLVLGAIGALGTTRLVASFLYGVAANDGRTLVASALLLGLVAGIAGFIPARRAATLDPMTALREE